MTTKIRTFITVCTLAFVGVLSAKATVNLEEENSGLIDANENLTVLNEKIASFESELNGSVDYQKEAQMITRLIADMAEAKAIKNVIDKGFIVPVETFNSAENEGTNEIINETTDILKEARLMTKFIADQEEAKVVKNVMERGFVVKNETANSLENEAVNETGDEMVDFGKEAQLLTKFIADQEEAKTVQKLVAEGKL
jgi:hypothetical protein